MQAPLWGLLHMQRTAWPSFFVFDTQWRLFQTMLQPMVQFAGFMKQIFVVAAAVACAGHVLAQDRIYRCGNEYTNTITEAQAKTCKLVSGGNVTVVPGVRAGSGAKTAATAPAAAPRVGADDQRSKDADARFILESELKKAEARHAELLKEYNNGEPEKLGPETRNHQKYLDRVAELKRSIERSESDMAGIKRELARVGGAAANYSGTAKQ